MKKVLSKAMPLICLCLMFCAAAFAYDVNDKVKVEWKGGLYPATIIKAEDGKYLVHYDGYASSWDEWVTENRIKSSSAPEYDAGDSVKVKWKGKWYPAKVLKVNNGKYLIHYEGYESNWDEWVGPGRMKK
jgi:hypothetical protein